MRCNAMVLWNANLKNPEKGKPLITLRPDQYDIVQRGEAVAYDENRGGPLVLPRKIIEQVAAFESCGGRIRCTIRLENVGFYEDYFAISTSIFCERCGHTDFGRPIPYPDTDEIAEIVERYIADLPEEG